MRPEPALAAETGQPGDKLDQNVLRQVPGILRGPHPAHDDAVDPGLVPQRKLLQRCPVSRLCPDGRLFVGHPAAVIDKRVVHPIQR